MSDMNVAPIYRITACTQLLLKPSGFVDYGVPDEVGFFHEKEIAFASVMANACDMNETCFEFAIIEEVKPGLYTWVNNRWVFKYDRDLDEYIEIETPAFLKPLRKEE